MVSPNGDAFACPISEIDEPPGAQKNQAQTETRPREDLDAEGLRRFAKHQAELAMSDGSPRTRRARRRQRVREADEARAILAKPDKCAALTAQKLRQRIDFKSVPRPVRYHTRYCKERLLDQVAARGIIAAERMGNVSAVRLGSSVASDHASSARSNVTRREKARAIVSLLLDRRRDSLVSVKQIHGK